VLANDSDADGDALSAVLVSGPQTHAHAERQRLVHLHAGCNFNGVDSFVYRATDGSSNSNNATVAITVNAVNDAPANTVPGRKHEQECRAVFSAAAATGSRSATWTPRQSGPGHPRLPRPWTLTLASTGPELQRRRRTADATMTFTGHLANINAALNGAVTALAPVTPVRPRCSRHERQGIRQRRAQTDTKLVAIA